MRKGVFAAIIVLTGIAIVSVAALRSNRTSPRKVAASPLRMKSDISPCFIPLILRGGMPFLNARINGPSFECQFDTGWNGIGIPTELAGAEMPTVRTGSSYCMNGLSRRVKETVLKNVEIGVCGFQNVPASIVPGMSLKTATGYVSHGQTRRNCPILGLNIFANSAITIDLSSKTLTVEGKDYSVFKQSLGPNDCILNLASNSDGSAIPMTLGLLRGNESIFMFDTGSQKCFATDESFNRIERKVGGSPFTVDTPFGPTPATSLTGDFGMVGGNKVSGDWIIVKKFASSGDAILGCEFMKNYRITIDGVNKKLRLAHVNGRKTGAFQ